MSMSDKAVTDTHTSVVRVLQHIEAAQAEAAACTAMITALGGGAAAADGYDWPAGVTAQNFYDALSSLATKLPALLAGGDNTNLYGFKQKMS